MLPLNHKRKRKSLAPDVFYLSKNLDIKLKVEVSPFCLFILTFVEKDGLLESLDWLCSESFSLMKIFSFFAVKLGHFIINDIFPYATNSNLIA